MKRLPALSLVLLAIVPACSASSLPTAPTDTSMTGTTLASCASWAGQQRGVGVPPGTGTVPSQRQSLLNAGGGVRTVGGRYYAAYFSSGFASASVRRIFVGLHGTGGAPESDWNDWRGMVDARGWGYLSLKYVDDATGVHDDEAVIYSNLELMIDELRASCDASGASFFLVGFSRGSANAFPVAYLDLHDRRFFKAIGNNSGAWFVGGQPTFTLQGVAARQETGALAGARFWMYCGGRDRTHGYPMCDEMDQAAAFVRTYGGSVERIYEDPAGGHGGLPHNAVAAGEMFTYFESLR